MHTLTPPARALMIVNPISGTRSKRGLDSDARAALKSAGISLDSHSTAHPGHARELALMAIDEGYDIVISAGGDGTVNEISTAIAHSDVTLGILPLGSGNGLARSLGIPQDTDEALKIITAGNSVRCDRGIVNGQPFYCTFGVGFDAAVTGKFAAMKRRGRITYVQSVILEFLKYQPEPYIISTGGEVITERAFLITVCNAPQYGNNAYIAPGAKLDDGLLDLIVIHDGNPLSTMKVGVDLLTGFIDRNTRIDSFKVKEATIARLSEGPVQADGEPLQLGNPLRISCDAGALSVFCAPDFRDFKPLVSPLKSLWDDLRYDVKAKLHSARQPSAPQKR